MSFSDPPEDQQGGSQDERDAWELAELFEQALSLACDQIVAMNKIYKEGTGEVMTRLLHDARELIGEERT